MTQGENSCPNCGSPEAVSKSAAWDAAAQIPSRVSDELKRLHDIELAAKALISSSPHPGNEDIVVVTVPVSLLSSLAKATGRELKYKEAFSDHTR